jgi:ribosome-binding protein aMBF1 (putative translation factor)
VSKSPAASVTVTVPEYLRAVRAMNGIGVGDMARALRVTPSVVRRWLAGTLVPTWRRVKSMTALWGGDAELLALGAALQRYCRSTGVSLEDAVRMVRSGRRTRPERRAPVTARDRRQLSLPIAR